MGTVSHFRTSLASLDRLRTNMKGIMVEIAAGTVAGIGLEDGRSNEHRDHLDNRSEVTLVSHHFQSRPVTSSHSGSFPIHTLSRLPHLPAPSHFSKGDPWIKVHALERTSPAKKPGLTRRRCTGKILCPSSDRLGPSLGLQHFFPDPFGLFRSCGYTLIGGGVRSSYHTLLFGPNFPPSLLLLAVNRGEGGRSESWD